MTTLGDGDIVVKQPTGPTVWYNEDGDIWDTWDDGDDSSKDNYLPYGDDFWD